MNIQVTPYNDDGEVLEIAVFGHEFVLIDEPKEAREKEGGTDLR